MGEVRSQPRNPPRCPQSCSSRRSLPRCLIPHGDNWYCNKWKRCTRAPRSTSALKYMVSITTFWDAHLIVMLCTIDNHQRLQNMLVARSSNQCQVKSGSSHRYRVMNRTSTITEGRSIDALKVGFQVVLLYFWARRFLCFFMNGHPQATVVLCPCSLSQGFEEATMGITVFHFIWFLLYGV